jgi:hypothetical protein
MTLLLRWRQPDRPLILRWRGPDDRVAAVAAADTLIAIPTVIGPPGPPGQMPETIDCGTLQ